MKTVAKKTALAMLLMALASSCMFDKEDALPDRKHSVLMSTRADQTAPDRE